MTRCALLRGIGGPLPSDTDPLESSDTLDAARFRALLPYVRFATHGGFFLDFQCNYFPDSEAAQNFTAQLDERL